MVKWVPRHINDLWHRKTSPRLEKQMVMSHQMTRDISYCRASKRSWSMKPRDHSSDKAHARDCHDIHSCVVINDQGEVWWSWNKTKLKNTDLLQRTYLSTDCCEKGKFVCLAPICFVIVKSSDFSARGELGKIKEEKTSYRVRRSGLLIASFTWGLGNCCSDGVLDENVFFKS